MKKEARRWFNALPIEVRQDLCKKHFREIGMNATLLSDDEVVFIYDVEVVSDKEACEEIFKNRGTQRSPFGIGS